MQKELTKQGVLITSFLRRIFYLPIYHVGVVAVATSVDDKWLDNLLARFSLPGVDRSGQGVARRISAVGLRHILLVQRLTRELTVPMSRAVDLAIRALTSSDGVVPLGSGLELRVDIAKLSKEAEDLLAEAVESIVPARRGRPPKTRTVEDPK